MSTFHILGFTQTVLVFSLGVLLSLTPTPYTPAMPNTAPNPAQTASPLSRLFFVFLEGRMYRYYARTSKTLARLLHLETGSLNFKQFVPPLPDYLQSDFVLGRFRWEGDGGAFAAKSKSSRQSAAVGRGREFVWQHKRDIAEIVAFATGWIVFIFLSPLSMNLVSRGGKLPKMPTRRTDLARYNPSAPSLRPTIRNAALRPLALPLRSAHLHRARRPIRVQPSSALPGRATRTSIACRTRSCDLCEAFADQGRRRELEAG